LRLELCEHVTRALKAHAAPVVTVTSSAANAPAPCALGVVQVVVRPYMFRPRVQDKYELYVVVLNTFIFS
jgi:hypothetical protein